METRKIQNTCPSFFDMLALNNNLLRMRIYALMFIVCTIWTLLWSTPCMKKDKWKQIHNICYWILLILYLDIGCLVSVTSLTAEFCAVFPLPSLLKEAHKFSIDIFDCDNDTVSIYIHCISSILTILFQHGYSSNNVRNKFLMMFYLWPPFVYWNILIGKTL